MTTEAALQEMNRQIGILIAGVDDLRRDYAASDAKADHRLANVHRRLDDLVDDVGGMQSKLSGFAERMTEIEKAHVDQVMPTVDKVRTWEQRGVGAIAAIGLVFTGFGFVIATFWHEFVAKIVALVKP